MPSLSIQTSPRFAVAPEVDVPTLASHRAWVDLVALATQLTGCTMGLMSLSDSATTGAGIGLSASQAPLLEDLACYAIATPDGALTITDAAADGRLASHPLVHDAPRIRFYASVGITNASGDVVGSLAVLSADARALTPDQARALAALARQAASLIDAASRAERAETLAQSLSLECTRLTHDAQRRRKEDGELLELVLRGGDLGLWDLDVSSGHWSVNAREYAMLGYPQDAKPATLDWKSLVHPDDWPVIWASFKRHLDGSTAFCEAEHRLRHRDGHWIWVLNRCVAVERDAAGRAVRVVGTHMDVTERKLEEDARRQAGDRLALALSGGDIGLWDLDVRTGRATYNEQWWRMFGYDSDELETVDGLWQSMVHPDDYADAREGLAGHVNGQSPMYEGEVRVRHKDGHWLWIQNRAKVVERDGDGAAVRIVGINLNITQSKQNSLALKRTTDLLQRTSALARVGGWEIDATDGAMQWSDEVYRIHDLDRSWTPSIREALKFYRMDTQPALVSAVKSAMAGGPGWDLELPMTTAAGRQIWVRSLGQGVRGDSGNGAARMVGTIQDITELKQARERLLDEQRRLQLITDNLPASVTHVDRLERFTFANRYSAKVLGEDPARMLGRTLREVQGNALYAPQAGHVRAALGGQTVAFESERDAAGQKSYLQTNLVPEFTVGGEVQGFFAMTFDVTERKRAELQSAASERRLRGLTDNVPVLITELDLHERIVFCNGTHQAWFGTPPAAVLQQPIRQTISDAQYAWRKPFLDRAFAGETVSFEQSMPLPIGERVLQTIYLPQKDSEGRVLSLYCLTNDVTELKQKQLQLDALARKDTLTGLPNRRAFEERVLEAMARTRRSGDPIGVMYLDLDRFKGINDSLGHAAGDAVLQEFAQRLSLNVRETDVAARYAGDEFLILLEGLSSYLDAQGVASKILLSMRAPFEVVGQVVPVTTSIGFAMYHGDDEDLKSLLARADTALYAAKNDGRNRMAMAGVSQDLTG